MLRIHFTGEDLARTRIASGPDVLWEALLSIHMVQDRSTGQVSPASADFARWRRAVRPRITAQLQEQAPLLGELAPPVGYSADFLTPTAGSGDMEAAVDAVLSTPRLHLQRDIGRLAAVRRPLSGRLALLSEGDPRTLGFLGHALHSYHRIALAPYWHHVQEQIAADRAVRVAALAEGGTERLLAGLHPGARWEPPVLVLAYPRSQDLYLEGRGLILVPSFFCWGMPITLREPGTTPVLVYPIARRSGWTGEEARGTAVPDPLVALLGRTRAQVLYELTHGCGTRELARRIGVSDASASQHATALRQAGLVISRRSGNSVHHSLTGLGLDLLLAGGPWATGRAPRPAG
ncbi:winged helix-turn-helix domain-containing protein [Streptomyces morookaense]|uniref:ArsR/SmtB family transcription factor n=1 Tax=Streptomyces morookaense TaxID=1970 RepID=UPI0033FDBC1A